MKIKAEELFEFAQRLRSWEEGLDAESEKTVALRAEIESLTEERNEANTKIEELEEDVKSTTALWEYRKKLSEQLLEELEECRNSPETKT